MALKALLAAGALVVEPSGKAMVQDLPKDSVHPAPRVGPDVDVHEVRLPKTETDRNLPVMCPPGF